MAQLQRKQSEQIFRRVIEVTITRIHACQNEISSFFSGTVFTSLLHAKITAFKDMIIHYNNDTDNRTRNLKKILTSEFCFTMKMYWKHRFLVWMDKLKQYHEKIYNKAEQSGLKLHPD